MSRNSVTPAPGVLVADDHAISRRYVAAALRQSHWHVKQAATPGEALSIALSWLPRLILIDVNLGDTNGFDLARSIRSRWPNSREWPQMVMLSADLPDSDMMKRAGHCVDGFLLKPVSVGSLLALVDPEHRPPTSVLQSADAPEPKATHRPRLGEPSGASGTRGVVRSLDAVEHSRLPPQAGAYVQGEGETGNRSRSWPGPWTVVGQCRSNCRGKRDSLPELRRLFQQELSEQLDRLDQYLAARDLAAAAGILHRLIASSGLCRELHLERRLRALDAACRNGAPASELGHEYFSLLVGARHFLAPDPLPRAQ